MISNKMKLEYKDYAEAIRLHNKSSIKLWYSFSVSLCFGILFILTIHRIKDNSASYYEYLTLSFFVVLIFFSSSFWTVFKAKKVYGQYKAMQEEYEVFFNEEKITFQSKYGFGDIPWKHVYQFKHNENLVLVYPAENLYHIILKRSLNPSEWQFLLQKIQEHEKR